jgi:arylsulfatase
VKTKGYCTDVFFRQAQTWIDSVQGRQPFFAYITPNAPHGPLDVAESYAAHYPSVPPNVAKFYGMIENIDENFGRLMAHLQSAGLEKNTLVIFLTDNGTATGAKVFNAGRRGAKGTAYQGGTRVPSFWRWPAAFSGGRDVGVLTAHIDMFRTLAEIGGAKLTTALEAQVEGRNLLPLLTDANAEWPDRFLVTHVGRWPHGQVEQWKYQKCSIRDARFTLVENAELFDLEADPGETKNVIAEHPEAAAKLRTAYDAWWQEVLPQMDNEDAVPPKMNPFKALYWQQFGGGPDEALRQKMDPASQGPGRN